MWVKNIYELLVVETNLKGILVDLMNFIYSLSILDTINSCEF